MWLSPLTWLLIAIALALLSIKSPRHRRWMLGSAMLLAGIAWLGMTPLFANTALRWLEDTDQSCPSPQPEWAVVLAGGSSESPASTDDIQVLGLATRRRLDAGADWWRKQPDHRRLAVSGGPMGRAKFADADVMATYLARQGVPLQRIAIERASFTTWENARRLGELKPALPRRIVLVTSASHMRRARYAMQQAGFTACALSADRQVTPLDFPGMLMPQTGSMLKTEAVLHELVGMVWYHWLAWRDPA